MVATIGDGGVILPGEAGAFSTDGADDRLTTRHKASITKQLPRRYIDDIRQVRGVKVATWATWFGAKDPQQRLPFFAGFAVDQETWFEVMEEMKVEPAALETWKRTRDGAILGEALAKTLQVKVGDRLTINSDIYPGDWELGATLEVRQHAPLFRRFVLTRDDDGVVVDLVCDRAGGAASERPEHDGARVDTPETILANKLTTIWPGFASWSGLSCGWAIVPSGLRRTVPRYTPWVPNKCSDCKALMTSGEYCPVCDQTTCYECLSEHRRRHAPRPERPERRCEAHPDREASFWDEEGSPICEACHERIGAMRNDV